ncbi:MAG: hypothetical protein JEZ06_11775 [Anaerolineaceae bacterium]|nr:hypothetical protein [Anaerolineaceae bacterium]
MGEDQLERYYSYLDQLHFLETQLVLLTRSRHSIQETSLDPNLFHHICWHEISGWFSEIPVRDEVACYFVDQFQDFLKKKGMSMEKVTWEFIEGIPAMVNLMNMLAAAISEFDPEIGVKKSMGGSWGGYYLGGEIFIGFRYANHIIIPFENNSGTKPSYTRELDLEKVHFFRSKLVNSWSA